MGDIIGGEYRITPRTFTATGQYGNCQIDENGRLLVTTAAEDASSALSTASALEDELVLAAASGSTGGFGKIGNLAATTGVMYPCIDASDKEYTKVDWRVKGAAAHNVQLYRTRTRVDSVTLTCGSLADTETLVVNGLTYTAEATANTATYDAFEFSVAGDDTADAAALAALINADYSVVTAGTSVAGTDKLIITTDEGAHTIVAKATSASYTTGQYLLNATAATELASIVLAINHTQNVTCASAQAGDTVTINGLVFTGHADTTTEANREWDIADDNAAAAALVTCINDATYGVPGVTASATGAVVYLYRDSEDDSITLTSSNATRLACVTTVGGVPGVVAAATPGTATKAELSITPTWTTVLTVTEEGNRLTVADIDCPGVYATSSEAVVTLTPGSYASGSGEKASVIYAVTGTAGAHLAVANNTLANLIKHGAATTGVADNSTTAGTFYEQWLDGWPYAYCGVTNTGSAAAFTVAATRYVSVS